MGVYQPTGYNENYMYLNMGMQTMPNGLVRCADLIKHIKPVFSFQLVNGSTKKSSVENKLEYI